MSRTRTPKILVAVAGGNWEPVRQLRAAAKRAVAAAIVAAEVDVAPGSEVSVLFAGDGELRALNARWRGKDKPTNVLSFPGRDMRPGETAGPAIGDIALARQTIGREARAQGKAFADHLSHLIVHGFLHLVGHDHLNERDARVMEAAERKALADLGVADPYEERPRRAARKTAERRRKPRRP